jgi:hypothetical protein
MHTSTPETSALLGAGRLSANRPTALPDTALSTLPRPRHAELSRD